MLLSPNFKDWFNLILAVLGVVGLPVGIWRWSVSTKTARDTAKTKGELAMSQINSMATNHFPHMEADLKVQTGQLNICIEKHEKQIELLGDISTNIKILVDRGVRL